MTMTNCVNLVLGRAILVRGNKVSRLLNRLNKVSIFDREKIFISHIIDEVKVDMSQCGLFLVKELGCISYHLNVVEVFLDLWIKQADFTLLELKVLIHVNNSTPCGFFPVSEHLLASHLKEVAHCDRLPIS